jgi:hypothetical protein
MRPYAVFDTSKPDLLSGWPGRCGAREAEDTCRPPVASSRPVSQRAPHADGVCNSPGWARGPPGPRDVAPSRLQVWSRPPLPPCPWHSGPYMNDGDPRTKASVPATTAQHASVEAADVVIAGAAHDELSPTMLGKMLVTAGRSIADEDDLLTLCSGSPGLPRRSSTAPTAPG